jgi:hypothetical protein
MKLLNKLLCPFSRRAREWRDATAYADQFHREARERMKVLADDGRGQKAFAESLKTLGIHEGTERPRLVSIGGTVIGDR